MYTKFITIMHHIAKVGTQAMNKMSTKVGLVWMKVTQIVVITDFQIYRFMNGP